MTETQAGAATRVELARNVRGVSSQRELPLDAGWEIARTSPGAAASPERLDTGAPAWEPAVVPGTAAMLQKDEAGRLGLDGFDHYYRCRFPTPPHANGRVILCCDGLATLAQVWLNGRLLFESDNMFHAHAHDVSAWLADEGQRNELCVRFAALGPVLRGRKARGRWPTRLVSEKNLRFVRTTLLGYMPGFCPDVRPVGPWRSVRLVVQQGIALERVELRPRLEPGRGVLEAAITCRLLGKAVPASAELVLGEDGVRAILRCEREGDRFVLRGSVALPGAAPWWPHTHGAPALHAAHVEVELGGERVRIDLDPIGFRTLELETGDDGDGFALRLNGQRLFCRGACFTPLDVAALHASDNAYRAALEQAREGGMNMLRVGGTMVYESDAFYRLCDELGILLFQDFMFANMDYPVQDTAFMQSCTLEARQVLERVGSRPSLAVLCGGSEVAQQAAMMGMPAELWSNALFDRVLPELCAERCPEVPYVPSSPWRGAMPFYSGAGLSHYYGVGAYLRPIDDARLTRVRFASECLAFSNVPDDESLLAWLGDASAPAHSPRYKERVPRDGGAGWDFADVTDHYVEQLFGVEARRLRYADHDRYLALCRATTGEVMARVQGMWRRRDSSCRGALVWFLRDLWPGAGWGVIDASGAPKAAYHHLKRAWAQLALWFTDEGVDGLSLHADNEGPQPVSGRVELLLYRADGTIGERAETALELAARGQQSLSVEALLGRFVDSSYAFRFGPPAFPLVVARLCTAGQGSELLAEAFHLPLGLGHTLQPDVGLSATAAPSPDGSHVVTVTAERFAQSVVVEAKGYVASDNHFHLAPRTPHRVLLRPLPGAPALRGRVRALNAVATTLLKRLDAADSA